MELAYIVDSWGSRYDTDDYVSQELSYLIDDYIDQLDELIDNTDSLILDDLNSETSKKYQIAIEKLASKLFGNLYTANILFEESTVLCSETDIAPLEEEARNGIDF